MTTQTQTYSAHLTAITGPARGAAGAAWRCDTCEVWWGIQNGPKPTTKFLLQLPTSLADQLNWDEYRGWKLAAAEAGVCPECGRPTGRILHAVA